VRSCFFLVWRAVFFDTLSTALESIFDNTVSDLAIEVEFEDAASIKGAIDNIKSIKILNRMLRANIFHH
jgi:hypothetical protein